MMVLWTKVQVIQTGSHQNTEQEKVKRISSSFFSGPSVVSLRWMIAEACSSDPTESKVSLLTVGFPTLPSV